MFALAAIQLTAAGAATPAADGSYDAVERARSLLVGSSTSDSSYDQAEASRARIVLPAQAADRSYDDVEKIRSLHGGG